MTTKSKAHVTPTAARNVLDGQPISHDEFQAMLNGLLAEAKAIASERGWCSAWWSYFGMLTLHIPYNGGTPVDAITVTPQGMPDGFDLSWLTPDGLTAFTALQNAKYATEAAAIRGRVLYWVSDGQINLEQANRVFQAAGLGTAYGEPPSRQFLVYMPNVWLTVPGDGELPNYPAINVAINEAMNGPFREAITAAGYTMDTTFGGHGNHDGTADASRVQPRVTIKRGDIVQPLERRR